MFNIMLFCWSSCVNSPLNSSRNVFSVVAGGCVFYLVLVAFSYVCVTALLSRAVVKRCGATMFGSN